MSYSNIKFNDNLIKNKTCKITYSGHLFQNGSEFVNIVYGFGSEWHHTKEQEMEKTENGFEVSIKMLNFDNLNFCFRNSNYEWDNNNNQNYTSPIAEEIEEEVNFILNDESVISNIMNNLCEIDVSDITEEKLEPIESIQSATLTEGTPFEVEVETNIPVNIEDSLVNITESESLDKDIESLFTDIYQNATLESLQTSMTNSFNMDNLIDEILSPVVKTENFIENEFNENINDFEDESNLDDKIDTLITNLFNNTKAFSENQNNNESDTISDVENSKEIDQRIDEILSETPSIFEKAVIENTQNITPEQSSQKTPDFTVIEEEESIIETSTTTNSEDTSSNTSSTQLSTSTDLVVSPRALGKFYMFKKKIKLAVTKLFVTIPKLLSKGFDSENN